MKPPNYNYKLNRQDDGYLPSEGEHMSAYVNRLKSVLQQSRYAYMPKHEDWHTHYGPSPCWICNIADCADYLASLLDDIVKNDKKRRWVCTRPKGSHDPLMYEFMPTHL